MRRGLRIAGCIPSSTFWVSSFVGRRADAQGHSPPARLLHPGGKCVPGNCSNLQLVRLATSRAGSTTVFPNGSRLANLAGKTVRWLFSERVPYSRESHLGPTGQDHTTTVETPASLRWSPIWRAYAYRDCLSSIAATQRQTACARTSW